MPTPQELDAFLERLGGNRVVEPEPEETSWWDATTGLLGEVFEPLGEYAGKAGRSILRTADANLDLATGTQVARPGYIGPDGEESLPSPYGYPDQPDPIDLGIDRSVKFTPGSHSIDELNTFIKDLGGEIKPRSTPATYAQIMRMVRAKGNPDFRNSEKLRAAERDMDPESFAIYYDELKKRDLVEYIDTHIGQQAQTHLEDAWANFADGVKVVLDKDHDPHARGQIAYEASVANERDRMLEDGTIMERAFLSVMDHVPILAGGSAVSLAGMGTGATLVAGTAIMYPFVTPGLIKENMEKGATPEMARQAGMITGLGHALLEEVGFLVGPAGKASPAFKRVFSKWMDDKVVSTVKQAIGHAAQRGIPWLGIEVLEEFLQDMATETQHYILENIGEIKEGNREGFKSRMKEFIKPERAAELIATIAMMGGPTQLAITGEMIRKRGPNAMFNSEGRFVGPQTPLPDPNEPTIAERQAGGLDLTDAAHPVGRMDKDEADLQNPETHRAAAESLWDNEPELAQKLMDTPPSQSKWEALQEGLGRWQRGSRDMLLEALSDVNNDRLEGRRAIPPTAEEKKAQDQERTDAQTRKKEGAAEVPEGIRTEVGNAFEVEPVDDNERRRVGRVEENAGVKIHFFKSTSPKGKPKPGLFDVATGEIWINSDTYAAADQNTPWATNRVIGHEILHSIIARTTMSPKRYRKLREAIQRYDAKGLRRHTLLYLEAAKSNKVDLTESELEEEGMAAWVAANLDRVGLWKKLSKDQAAYQGIKAWVQTAWNAMPFRSKQSKVVREYMKMVNLASKPQRAARELAELDATPRARYSLRGDEKLTNRLRGAVENITDQAFPDDGIQSLYTPDAEQVLRGERRVLVSPSYDIDLSAREIRALRKYFYDRTQEYLKDIGLTGVTRMYRGGPFKRDAAGSIKPEDSGFFTRQRHLASTYGGGTLGQIPSGQVRAYDIDAEDIRGAQHVRTGAEGTRDEQILKDPTKAKRLDEGFGLEDSFIVQFKDAKPASGGPQFSLRYDAKASLRGIDRQGGTWWYDAALNVPPGKRTPKQKQIVAEYKKRYRHGTDMRGARWSRTIAPQIAEKLRFGKIHGTGGVRQEMERIGVPKFMLVKKWSDRVHALASGMAKIQSKADTALKDDKAFDNLPAWVNTRSIYNDWHTELVRLALQGEVGRFWYEKVSDHLIETYGLEVGEKIAVLLAITSKTQNLSPNYDDAIQMWEMFKQGKPFFETNKKTGEVAHVVGKDSEVARIAEDFLKHGHAVLSQSIKRNNFYINLLKQIRPELVQGATIDTWMMQGMMYPQARNPTTPQYHAAAAELQKVADELGWEIQQVQAALWTAARHNAKVAGPAELALLKGKRKGLPAKNMAELEQRLEESKTVLTVNFADLAVKGVVTSTFETVPSPSSDTLPGMHKAPYSPAKEAYLFQSVDNLQDASGEDILAAVYGLKELDMQYGLGLYEGVFNPGIQQDFVAVKAAKTEAPYRMMDPYAMRQLTKYLATLGIVFKQDAMTAHKMFFTTKARDKNGIEFRIGRNPTEEDMSNVRAVMEEAYLAILAKGLKASKNLTKKGAKRFAESVALIPRSKEGGLRVLNTAFKKDNAARILKAERAYWDGVENESVHRVALAKAKEAAANKVRKANPGLKPKPLQEKITEKTKPLQEKYDKGRKARLSKLADAVLIEKAKGLEVDNLTFAVILKIAGNEVFDIDPASADITRFGWDGVHITNDWKNDETGVRYRELARTGGDGWAADNPGEFSSAQRAVNTVILPRQDDTNAQAARENPSWGAKGKPVKLSLRTDQQVTSAATSRKQLPAIFKAVKSTVGWRSGTTNLDIGGGRFDDQTDAMAAEGVENLVLDPFNRSKEHNAAVEKRVAADGVDTATIANVLNVIKEKDVRKNVLEEARDSGASEVYITVYAGKGDGKGAETRDGWQENRKLSDYVSEVREVLPGAVVKGRMIIANPAKRSLRYDESAPTPTESQANRTPLANIGVTDETRALVETVDAGRADRGVPAPDLRTRDQQESNAEAAFKADPAGVKKRLLQAAEDGESLNPEDTLTAKFMVNELSEKAFASGGTQGLFEVVSLVEAYRDVGHTQSVAFRNRYDPRGQSEEDVRRRVLTEAIVTLSPKMQKKLSAAKKSKDKAKVQAALAEATAEVEKWLKLSLKLGLDPKDITEVAKNRKTSQRLINEIATRKGFKISNALYEYWISSLLSGPTTQLVNVAGNMGHLAYASVVRAPTSFIGALTGRVTKGAPGSEGITELAHFYAGFLPGLKRGIRNAWISWRDEAPSFELEHGESQQGKVELKGHSIPSINGKWGGKQFRWPLRALQALDELTKSISGQMEAAAQAYRMGKAAGHKGQKLAAFMQAEIADPKSMAWSNAVDFARHMAFQNPNSAAIRQLTGFRDALPLVRYKLPFIKTLVNIFKSGTRYGPFGVLRLVPFGNSVGSNVLEGDLSKVPELAVEQALAWSFMVWLFMENGDDDPFLTGNSGKAGRLIRYREGTPPDMSIKIPGYGWLNYSRIEPFATILPIVVDLTNGWRNNSPTQVTEAVLNNTIGAMGEKTFASGIADVIDLIQSDDKTREASEQAGQFAASWIPNGMKQWDRASDTTFQNRKVWGQGQDRMERIVSTSKRRMEMGLDQDKDFPIIDVYGRVAERQTPQDPMTGTFIWNLLGVKYKADKGLHPGDELLWNYNLKHGDEREKNLGVPKPYFTVKGEKVWLDEREYYEWTKQSGKAVGTAIERAAQRNFINTKDPDESDLKELRKLARNARGKAKPWFMRWLRTHRENKSPK